MKKLFAFALIAAALATAATSCTPCTERKADYVCTVVQITEHGIVHDNTHTEPLFNVTPSEKAAFEAANTWVRYDANGFEIRQTTTCQ